MSFANLGSRSGSKPKTKAAEPGNDSFESLIKVRVEVMQDLSRGAKENLDRVERGSATPHFSAGVLDLNDYLARMDRASQDVQQLFRSWTVQMAGDPAERKRKRFVYEKLQKAVDEETGIHEQIRARAATLLPPRQPAAVETASPLDDRLDLSGPGDLSLLEKGLVADEEGTPGLVAEHDMMNTIARERDESIRRIQNQVSDVSAMFRDLASIVVEQGEQLTTIESQAESASEHTTSAAKELKKAVSRQGGMRDRLLFMLFLAVTFICLVVPQAASSSFLRVPAPGVEEKPAAALPAAAPPVAALPVAAPPAAAPPAAVPPSAALPVAAAPQEAEMTPWEAPAAAEEIAEGPRFLAKGASKVPALSDSRMALL